MRVAVYACSRPSGPQDDHIRLLFVRCRGTLALAIPYSGLTPVGLLEVLYRYRSRLGPSRLFRVRGFLKSSSRHLSLKFCRLDWSCCCSTLVGFAGLRRFSFIHFRHLDRSRVFARDDPLISILERKPTYSTQDGSSGDDKTQMGNRVRHPQTTRSV